MRRSTQLVLLVAGVLWISGLAFGIYQLQKYEITAGPTAQTAQAYPADMPPLHPDGYTAVVFLHPECPCSRATLSSLNQIMAHSDGKLRAYVIAVLSKDAPPEWKDTPLIAEARIIPNATILTDENAHFAAELGAFTSGQTDLFNAQGQKVFAGGITAGRGHEGDNPGMSNIESILLGHLTSAPGTPVYGCALPGRSYSSSNPK